MTQPRREAIIADVVQARLTLSEIAAKYGIHRRTVYGIRDAAGIPRGRLLPAGYQGEALGIGFRLAIAHDWPLSYIIAGLAGAFARTAKRWWARNYPMTPAPNAHTTSPKPYDCDTAACVVAPADLVVGCGKRLSLQERVTIGVMHHKFGMSAASIGRELGRCRQTISRELRRGIRDDGLYDPAYSQQLAESRRARPKELKIESNPALRAEVVRLLSTPRSRTVPWHSPRLISKRLRTAYPEDPTMNISAESIYQALYVQGAGSLRQELKVEKALRSGRVRRIPQSRLHGARPGRGSRSFIGNAVLANRPAEVDDRAIPGHWEGDLVIGAGGKSALITLIERTSRYVMVRRLADNHTSRTCTDALVDMVTALPEDIRKTLTWDRGVEMALHVEFTVATGCAVYFCDPYKPWQRGSNENINRSIREYFPKGTDFATVTDQEIQDMEYELNTRARMVLDGFTPVEVLTRLIGDAGGALTP